MLLISGRKSGFSNGPADVKPPGCSGLPSQQVSTVIAYLLCVAILSVEQVMWPLLVISPPGYLLLSVVSAGLPT
jgi:hypothetical protein